MVATIITIIEENPDVKESGMCNGGRERLELELYAEKVLYVCVDQ